MKSTSLPPISPNKGVGTQVATSKETGPAPAAYASYQFQHAGESHNPFPDLLANLNKTMVMHIHAYSEQGLPPIQPTQNVGAAQRRSSLISTTGFIEETRSYVPPLFALACADVCRDLGLHSISMRTTGSSLQSLLTSPKPPDTKLKLGDAGITYGVIPVKIEHTTRHYADGKLHTLEQDPKYKPPQDGDIVPTQYPIPLERIILGLNARPPEMEIVNSPDPKTGILEVSVICDDPLVANTVYRINLLADTKPPTASDSLRTSPAQQSQPSWWQSSFGSYQEKVKCGYPLTCQEPGKNTFEPFEVYGRKIGDEIAIISGDQDVFTIPRSTKYDVGDLDKVVINTNTVADTDELISKLRRINNLIIKQDVQNMIPAWQATINNSQHLFKSPDKTQEFLQFKILEYSQNRVQQLNNLIVSSKKYIVHLGQITPWEAYVIIQCNLKEQNILEHFKHDPKSTMKRVEKVFMESSIGLKHILQYQLDADLHPAWWEAKQDPAGCKRHIDNQLNHNRWVSPENLLAYVQEKKALYAAETTQLQTEQHAAVMKSTRESPLLTTELAAKLDTLKNAWPQPLEIYVREKGGTFRPYNANDPVQKPREIIDILVSSSENGKKQVTHFQENRITSSRADNSDHIKSLLSAAQLGNKAKQLVTPSPATSAKELTQMVSKAQQQEVKTSHLPRLKH